MVGGRVGETRLLLELTSATALGQPRHFKLQFQTLLGNIVESCRWFLLCLRHCMGNAEEDSKQGAGDGR